MTQWELFSALKLEVWKDECLKELKNSKWLSDEVRGYAEALNDPEFESALWERYEKILKHRAKEKNSMPLPDLADYENYIIGKQMAELPLKLVE